MSEQNEYAIIRTGGKQHKVQAGCVINIDRQTGEKGESVTFDDVLLVSKGGNVNLGTPAVSGVSVSGIIVGHDRGEKVIAYKKKRRKGFHWKKGHRQDLTQVRIESIG